MRNTGYKALNNGLRYYDICQYSLPIKKVFP